jgi:hypothetical protein
MIWMDSVLACLLGMYIQYISCNMTKMDLRPLVALPYTSATAAA